MTEATADLLFIIYGAVAVIVLIAVTAVVAWGDAIPGESPDSDGYLAGLAYGTITGMLWPACLVGLVVAGVAWLAGRTTQFAFRSLCLHSSWFAHLRARWE